METPPARGRDVAMLQGQLNSTSGQRLHRRRVSRSLQMEDSFFTPKTSPHEFSASARLGSPHGAQYIDSITQFRSPHVDDQLNSREWAPARSLADTNQGGSLYGDASATGHKRPAKPPSMGSSEPSSDNSPHNYRDDRPQVNLPAPGGNADNSLKKKDMPSGESEKPSKNSARALSSRRRCAKCEGDISGHFVRALGAAFHIDCFTCADCDVPCAAKFFPVDNKPLCEHCYFKRQNLLCYRCGNSLRGSYITALDRKYHVEHFTCSLCTTVFGPDDSYFEYNGDVYCRCHYSALFAFHCEGCKSPILKQFVETYRGGKQQQWHPECYMIFKFWSVKVADRKARETDTLRQDIVAHSDPHKPLDPRAVQIIDHEDMIDRRTMRTWTTLCGFEEVCAAEISTLVQSAVAGNFDIAYETSARLVAHIKILFTSIDMIPKTFEASNDQGETQRDHGKEAKTLCRKVVSYMSLLSKTRDLPDKERLQGLTKDLLTLASAIAHYLKVLIRQGLAGAVKQRLLDQFLASVGAYTQTGPPKTVSPFSTDRCLTCGKAVEDKCYRQRGRNDRLWHARPQCFRSAVTGVPLDPKEAAVDSGHLVESSNKFPPAQFVYITKLEQYVILLHVALARFDLVLTNNKRPKSEEPPPTHHKQAQLSEQVSASVPILPGQKSADMNSGRLPYDSTVKSPHNQSHGRSKPHGTPPTALERASSILNEKAGLTLDDIRRIVASEQARTSELPKQVPQQIRRRSTEPALYFGSLSEEEYSWVRHIAQAMLEPLSMKYLSKNIDIVNVASPVTKQGTIWGRMGKVFAPKEPEGRVFGQPLDRLVAKYGVDSNLVGTEPAMSKGPQYVLRIPSFVDDCITAMRQKDMSVEGVFRKNGNIRRLREFVEKIDKNPDENGLLVDESPIQLAALLKKFLRDLPDPLLCAKLSGLWSVVAVLDLPEQIRLVQLLICVLPKPNRNLTEVLLNFLNWVSSFAHVDDESGSKMDISNLATVFGPTLVLSSEEAASLSGTSLDIPGGVGSTGTFSSSEAGPSNSSSHTGDNGSSRISFKNVSEPVKLMIGDCGVLSEVPDDVAKCLRFVKGPPRKLSYSEIQEMLRR